MRCLMFLRQRFKKEQKFLRVAYSSHFPHTSRMRNICFSHARNALILLFFAAGFLVPSTRAASFDCTRAHAADERAVCASRALSEMDVEMAVRFEMLTG